MGDTPRDWEYHTESMEYIHIFARAYKIGEESAEGMEQTLLRVCARKNLAVEEMH